MNKDLTVVIEKDKQGNLVVSSRVIAEGLGKEHRDVLNKIREVLNEREFSLVEYTDKKGEKRPEYWLNKDSFVLLVMNYAGYNDFKRAYIKRFNEMEAELKNNFPNFITGDGIIALGNRMKQLELQLVLDKPKVEFFEQVTGSKDAIEMKAAANVTNFKNIGRNKLFEILRMERILNNDNVPYQKYIDAGYFRVIEQKYTVDGEVRINLKTVIYQKGLDFIIKLLQNKGY